MAATDEKIGDNLDNQGLLQTIAYIGHLIGVVPPNDSERMVLLDYIRANLSGVSTSEIKLAFTMALDGSVFNVDLSGKLSAAMIQRVMSGYKAYKHDVFRHKKENEDTWQMPDTDVIYRESLERIRNIYDEEGELGLINERNWVGKYNWMKVNGYFKGMPFDADDIKRRARQKYIRGLEAKRVAAKDMHEARRLKALVGDLKAGNPVDGEMQAIEACGKEIMVIEWLKWKSNEN